jgi:ParB-like chromosome segregation protein Spo0J
LEVDNIKPARLEVHPAAKIFPLLRGQKYIEFRDDIKANGLIWPVVLYEGKLLDGRNHESACIDTGTELRMVDGTESIKDPWAYVISANLHRRDLTDQQKRDAIIAYLAQAPEKSDRQVGKELGFSHPTVAKARKEAEATGKALPVEKRTGADGKARKQPVKKPPARPKTIVVTGAGKTMDEVHAEVVAATANEAPASAPIETAVSNPAARALAPGAEAAAALEFALTEKLRTALNALRTKPSVEKKRTAIHALEYLNGLLNKRRLEPIDIEIVVTRTAGVKRTVH